MLLMGGVLLSVACAGCGGLGYLAYWLANRNSLVGTWEQTHPQGMHVRYTFTEDGRGWLEGAGPQVGLTYNLKNGVLEIQLQGQIPQGFRANTLYDVAIDGNGMTLTPIGINDPNLATQRHFRRVVRR